MTVEHKQPNQVSKSIKNLFMKLRGTSQTEKSLFSTPLREMDFTPSLPMHSTRKKSKRSIKNHQLPLIDDFRRYRHTLDLSNMNSVSSNIGVLMDQELRRTSSISNSSIYCTFTSSPLNHKSSQTSLSSAFSSDSSSDSSCIKQDSTSNSSANHLYNENIPLFVLNHWKQGDQNPHQLQKRLWDQDTSLCSKEDIAEYLGQSLPSRTKVLHLYMKNFNFSNQKLDVAFRQLCSKLYLKAESQQIDRILEAFAKRYYECNPTTLFHCVDVIHAVAYSILLLNTDLHVVNDWANKMTKSSFIKNTMGTIQSIVFPHLTDHHHHHRKLRRSSVVSLLSLDSYLMEDASIVPYSIFNSNQHNEIIEEEDEDQDEEDEVEALSINNYNGMIHALKSNISRKSHMYHGLSRTQKRWLADIENTLKDIFASVKTHRIDVSTPSLQRTKTLPKTENRRQRTASSSIYCEGPVMRKHVMESTDKRARHRQWQSCHLVVTETEMTMYKVKKSEQIPLGVLKMNHVYATVVSHPQRPYVFRLETAEGGLWLFETTSAKLTKVWVDACHLAAAKISKGPLSGAVCNIDYGWGAQWDAASKINQVPVWYPPSPCMVKSCLGLREQYQNTELQILELNKQLNRHRELKFSVDRKFEKGVTNLQALTNWDQKLHYILHELIKLGSYKDILQTQLYTKM